MKKTASLYKTLMYVTGCCFFMLGTLATHAQTRGKVEVIKDPRVDSLIARRMSGGKGSGALANGMGYRVQIYTGSNRSDAYIAQAKFQDQFPDTRSYITYQEPNFKVRIGDFRTRLEATKMLQELKPWFPLMFIISEKINPPKLDTDTQQ